MALYKCCILLLLCYHPRTGQWWRHGLGHVDRHLQPYPGVWVQARHWPRHSGDESRTDDRRQVSGKSSGMTVCPAKPNRCTWPLLLLHPFPPLCGVDVSYETPPFSPVLCVLHPDNSISDKSFLMLSNHLRFGLPLQVCLSTGMHDEYYVGPSNKPFAPCHQSTAWLARVLDLVNALPASLLHGIAGVRTTVRRTVFLSIGPWTG